MSAFDELYIRFFKNAVGSYLSAADARTGKDDSWIEWAHVWAAEARSWGLAARALAPYMNKVHIAQIERSVMGGRFTLSVDGAVIEVSDAAATKLV